MHNDVKVINIKTKGRVLNPVSLTLSSVHGHMVLSNSMGVIFHRISVSVRLYRETYSSCLSFLCKNASFDQCKCVYHFVNFYINFRSEVLSMLLKLQVISDVNYLVFFKSLCLDVNSITTFRFGRILGQMCKC